MFVVQIGACDGKCDFLDGIDEVYTLITECGWKGVLVEPGDYNFSLLQHTYSGYSDSVELLNIAIALHDGTIEFWDGAGQICSLLESHLHKHNIDYAKATTIKCLRINTLLGMFARPDYLAMDTEGYDGFIILDLDLDRFKIPKIKYESCHLEPALSHACEEKLQGYGYHLSYHNVDTIAELKI